jgi:preprotein translocase subunit YajC
MFHALLFVLQEAPAQAPAGPSSSLLTGPLVPMLAIGVLFFFLLILPERKKQKQRQKMLDALKKGDRVMTTSGIHATVVSASTDVVVLQVADSVRMRFSRAAVQNVLEPEKEPALDEKKAEPSKV